MGNDYRIIDNHVHIAGRGDVFEHDLYWSEKFDEIFKTIPASKLIYGSDFPNPAKGRKECILRSFLRFRKANLLNRYYRIASKWLKKYYSQEDCQCIMTNFHRVLDGLERGNLVKN